MELPPEIQELRDAFLAEISVLHIQIEVEFVEKQNLSTIVSTALRKAGLAWGKENPTFEETSRWDNLAARYRPRYDELTESYNANMSLFFAKWEETKAKMSDRGFIWPDDTPPSDDWPEIVGD